MLLVIVEASLSSTGLTFTPALIVAGIGMGCTFAPMITLAMRNVPPALAGSASGFVNTIRQVGGAFGSAVVGAVLQNQLANNLHSQAVKYSGQLPPQFRAKFVQGFSHASTSGFQVGRGQTGTKLPKGLPPQAAGQIEHLAKTVFDHAYILAMKPSLAFPIIFMVLGAFTALLMRSGQAPAAEAQEPSSGIAAAGH
jgi:hypothetical protein